MSYIETLSLYNKQAYEFIRTSRSCPASPSVFSVSRKSRRLNIRSQRRALQIHGHTGTGRQQMNMTIGIGVDVKCTAHSQKIAAKSTPAMQVLKATVSRRAHQIQVHVDVTEGIHTIGTF